MLRTLHREHGKLVLKLGEQILLVAVVHKPARHDRCDKIDLLLSYLVVWWLEAQRNACQLQTVVPQLKCVKDL